MPDDITPTPSVETDTVLIAPLTDDGVLRLTLDAPERRNPLSMVTMAALSGALSDAADDPATRAIVIAHNGPVLSAGHDLREINAARDMPDKGAAFYRNLMARCSDLMQAITNHPKPIIAQIDGTATAAGCQLVASCDLAYASPNSQFATPGVHIGLFCSTPMVALSRNVSNKHAMEMLLTGEPASAARAAEIGLINAVIEAQDLQAHVDEVATSIASKSMATVKIGKQAFYAQRPLSLDDAYRYASDVMVENLDYRDAKEGIDAFLGKRTPKWRDE